MFSRRMFSTTCSMGMAVLATFAQGAPPIRVLHPAGEAGDQFGGCVAIDGDTAIVGAYVDDIGANIDQGSAHIYRRNGTVWVFEATLTTAGGTNDLFGWSVALSGNTAIVGSPTDSVGSNAGQGAAYIFVRTGTTWSQQAQLVASDGQAYDQFGIAVALDGDTAIVGAYLDDAGAIINKGSAYVFVRNGTLWTQQAQLTASGGEAGDEFGWSLDLCGDTAIVGAPSDGNGANTKQGSAGVFIRNGMTWTQQFQLTADDGAAFDYFGYSVALSHDTAIVGALHDSMGANLYQGSAYAFVRFGVTWAQQAKLAAADGASSDSFGWSVALSDDTAIVGAPNAEGNANTNEGSAYVFVRSGTSWTERAKLAMTDGESYDAFGTFVALSGDTTIVGAPGDDVSINSLQGSAWIFSPVGSCPADYNGTGDAGDSVDFLDFFDDFGVCDGEVVPCGTYGNPDINGDTFIDVLDFLDFLEGFSEGC
jgi:hypothetical protein